MTSKDALFFGWVIAFATLVIFFAVMFTSLI